MNVFTVTHRIADADAGMDDKSAATVIIAADAAAAEKALVVALEAGGMDFTGRVATAVAVR